MKKERRNILVYTDDTVKWYTQLTIQVDDAGNKWLAPGQVDFLEFTHNWVRYEGSSQLKASRTLMMRWGLLIPQVGAPVATYGNSGFARSTPASNKVRV